MDKNLFAFIQVRLGSSRLPEKAMLKIGNKNIIEHIISRLEKIIPRNKIAIVTSTSQQDDKLVNYFADKKIDIFRGSEENALERFYLAAKKFGATHIIRATGDNPFIDYRLIQRIMDEVDIFSYDYVGEGVNKIYPLGTAVEFLSYNALKLSNERATTLSEQEHITPYIFTHPNEFNIFYLTDVSNNSNIRLTIDTKEDYEVAKLIYDKLGDLFTIDDILNNISELDDILKKNMNIKQRKVI